MSKHFTYDADKVKELRMKVIHLTLEVLDDKPSVKKWSNYKKELVAKIAPRVLPQLNAGRDDDEKLFPAPIYAGQSVSISRRNGNQKDISTDEED